MDKISDFRSDTVTRPTEKMRAAMAAAEVGDDVLGDDPTVKLLEQISADMFGKEAALYVPSGTMANTIAVKLWTKALDEVIVEERSHIYNMESTQMTFISRITPRPVPSDRGRMEVELIEKAIRKPSVHTPRTSLICLESSHNNWGGAVIPLQKFEEIRETADRHGLKIHLDGARIFNASVASGISIRDFAGHTDSMMFCLSKGLSAPVGSLLLGPRDFIEEGRRFRKVLGGGMRQVGVIAAAGIIAVTEMTERLIEDHVRAKTLASEISCLPGIILKPEAVETNILIFGLEHKKYTCSAFLSALKERGVLALAVSGGIRFVTHKDVDDSDVARAVGVFRSLLG